MKTDFGTYRVQPYEDHEIPRCACCGKKMRVSFPEHIELIPKGRPDGVTAGFSASRQLETEFRTNQRIVWRTSEWGYSFEHEPNRIYHGRPDKYEERPWKPVPYIIRLTLYNDQPRRWGSDGLFCSGPCRDEFAYAAYRAGYRIKIKEEAA